jgi:glycosyltransferase involved in cell wall biosynthesis
MRVAMLSKALVTGAYQRKCELIAALGIELTALVPPGWGTQQLDHAHVHGYDLRVLPLRLNGNFHLHHYPTLRTELAQLRPDVFHIDEEPYNAATYLAMRACVRAAPKARMLFFSWQNINRAYPFPFRWMERAVLKQMHAGIVGNAESEQVWRSKGFRGLLRVIPQFGVDETRFVPETVPRERRHFWVGFAGRLTHDKGVDVLLRAIAKTPDTRAHILGDGDDAHRLRTLATELGIAGRVTFEPARPSTQMPAFYRELDALVLPSRTKPNWKEQFGRVLTEAMACAVPVIGARSGEIPNVIGDAGLLFAEGDADALATQLTRLKSEPALHADLRMRGRARVLAHYTMAQITAETVALYREI